MPPADIPDFDSMSPEEVMAWMESLAKRQGASEGFTTAADVEIGEVDPSSVQINEPGYVPFGEEGSTKKPASEPAAASAPPEEVPAAPPTPPAPETPAAVPEAAFDDEETQPAPTFEMGGMAWLESLAADQSSDFPQIDLSALSEALGTAAEPEPTNPLDWLESMTSEDAEAVADDAPEAAEAEAPQLELDLGDMTDIDDPLAAGVDPMAWLESLAKRQGVKDEELTTAANLRIPSPQAEEEPQPASFDSPPPAQVPREETSDPAAWLESLAAEGVPASAETPEAGGMSDEDIQQALARGVEIPRDEMAAFLDRQLQRQLEGGEFMPPETLYDPDAPAEKAELPDWLLEQVQPPSDVEAEPAPSLPPALLDEIIEPPSVEDLPDWLREDVVEESGELDDIFATEPEEESPAATASTFSAADIDTDDPWVVAFDEESQADPNIIPDWYERNLRDPQRIAAVERQAGVSSGLEAADLEPETSLPVGELEPGVPDWLSDTLSTAQEVEAGDVPDWLSTEMPAVAAAEAAEALELPDWLSAADTEIDSSDIPDWLRETMEEEAEAAESAPAAPVEAAPPAPAAPPVQQPAASVSPVPAPVAVSVDIEATLAQARRHVSTGNVAGGLIEYESIIRANKALDLVVSDLTQLVEQQKDNPAVYRVLGDGLMRQGKLQSALDTYRKALNQL